MDCVVQDCLRMAVALDATGRTWGHAQLASVEGPFFEFFLEISIKKPVQSELSQSLCSLRG